MCDVRLFNFDLSPHSLFTFHNFVALPPNNMNDLICVCTRACVCARDDYMLRSYAYNMLTYLQSTTRNLHRFTRNFHWVFFWFDCIGMQKHEWKWFSNVNPNNNTTATTKTTKIFVNFFFYHFFIFFCVCVCKNLVLQYTRTRINLRHTVNILSRFFFLLQSNNLCIYES